MQSRKNSILKLSLLIPFILSSCERPPVPNTPTVVMGVVVDENGTPLEGVPFTLDGYQRKGISEVPTFSSIYFTSNTNGEFVVEKLLPPKTQELLISAGDNQKFHFFGPNAYSLYVLRNGVYSDTNLNVKIAQESYGDTTILNLQIKANPK